MSLVGLSFRVPHNLKLSRGICPLHSLISPFQQSPWMSSSRFYLWLRCTPSTGISNGPMSVCVSVTCQHCITHQILIRPEFKSGSKVYWANTHPLSTIFEVCPSNCRL